MKRSKFSDDDLFNKIKSVSMKKSLLILIASIGIGFYLSAQSAGNYRSVGNGNWNDATSWEIYNGSNWVTTTSYPGQNSGIAEVVIMSGTEINRPIYKYLIRPVN